MPFQMLSRMLLLLIGGLALVFFPKVFLALSGMAALEDEAVACWFVRILGLIFVSIVCWFAYAAFTFRT